MAAQAAFDDTAAGAGRRMKWVGKPPGFSGDKKAWIAWEFAFTNWFGVVEKNGDKVLAVAAADRQDPELFADSDQMVDRALYAVLAQVCKDRAQEVVRQVRSRSGLVAWYELNREYAAPTNTVNDLQAILKYDFGSSATFRVNLLKWENQLADYANMTGETLSDRIKIAVLLGQAPSEVRSFLKLMAKQSYSSVRSQLLTYLDNTEADSMPMEIGWVGGKYKGDGKTKGDYKGKFKGDGKSKGEHKGKVKSDGKWSKGHDKGKSKTHEQKPTATSSFQGYCRGCGRWGHKHTECWRNPLVAAVSTEKPPKGKEKGRAKGEVAAVSYTEEVLDTGVLDPGWVFAVTYEDLMCHMTQDSFEVLVDSGSVETVCPVEFADDIEVMKLSNPPQLRDVSGKELQIHGRRDVPMILGQGQGKEVAATIVFVVAPVRLPILSVGKMNENGFTFAFDGQASFMMKDGIKVGLQPVGRVFVLRCRRRFARASAGSSSAHVSFQGVVTVAPVSLAAAADDGEEAQQRRRPSRAAQRRMARERRAMEEEDAPPAPGLPYAAPGLPVAAPWLPDAAPGLQDAAPLPADPAQIAEYAREMEHSAGAAGSGGPSQELPKVMKEVALPDPETVRRHQISHLPHAPRCEVCVRARGLDKQHLVRSAAPESAEWMRMQIDYMFVSGDNEFVDEARSVATILVVYGPDDGLVGATALLTKTHVYGPAFVHQFLQTYGYTEKLEIKTDSEASIEWVAKRVSELRQPSKTALQKAAKYSHQDMGAVERANLLVQSQIRAIRFDLEARLKGTVKLLPGTILFPWAVRHAAWLLVRFHERQTTKQTAFQRCFGRVYDGTVVPFGEVSMARVPHDGPKDRRKLDSVWLRAVWVGKAERSDEHLLLTEKGPMRARTVKRIPQPAIDDAVTFLDTVKGTPWDPDSGAAKLLRSAKVRPVAADAIPLPLGEKFPEAEERDDVEQNCPAAEAGASSPPAGASAMETDAAAGASSSGADPGTSTHRAPSSGADPGVAAKRGGGVETGEEETAKRLRLRAKTGVVRQPESEQENSAESKRARLEAMIAELVGSVSADIQSGKSEYEEPMLRDQESIQASRQAEIDTWFERGAIERWPRKTAIDTKKRFLTTRWVDDPVKFKSRFVVREFATDKDPDMFAATAGNEAVSIIDHAAVLKSWPIVCFDVSSAYTHAAETELIFIEPPEEDKAKYPDMVWRPLRIINGRRKGARSWREHFVTLVTSSEAKLEGFDIEENQVSPGYFRVNSDRGLLVLHVDDGYGTGEAKLMEGFSVWLAKHLELKWVANVGADSKVAAYTFLKHPRLRLEDGTLLRFDDVKYVMAALQKYGMCDCSAAPSPKLDKAFEDGDDEKVSEDEQATFRSAVLTVLYVSQSRPDMQSTVRKLCTRLGDVTCGDLRQLKRLLRYAKGTLSMATVFRKMDGFIVKEIWIYSDSDWATDLLTRFSVSGCVIIISGHRVYSHSKGQHVVALSSCESEFYAASEAVKVGLFFRELLQFAGFGRYMLRLFVDASATKAFLTRQGVGKMKHIAARELWLQQLVQQNEVIIEKLPRAENPADVLTHPPSTRDLEKLLPMMQMKVMMREHREATNREAAHYHEAVRHNSGGSSSSSRVAGLMTSLLGLDMVRGGEAFGSQPKQGEYGFLMMVIMALVLVVAVLFLMMSKGTVDKVIKKDVGVQTAFVAESVPPVVYVTPGGEKFHRAKTCPAIRSSSPKAFKPCQNVCCFRQMSDRYG